MRGFFFILVAFFLIVTSTFADSTSLVTSFFNQTTKKVQDVINDKDKKLKSNNLTKIFNEVVDVEWMGRFALGMKWKGMNDSQKASYMLAYRDYIVRSYVDKFMNYKGKLPNLSNIRQITEDIYIADTEIINEGVKNKISYRLKIQEHGNIKIRDIVVEGVSLIRSQRSEFASVLENKGIDDLIKDMNKSVLK